MNKHKSNKIKENSNTVRHLIMGQITTTQNLVTIKENGHSPFGQNSQSVTHWPNGHTILVKNATYSRITIKRVNVTLSWSKTSHLRIATKMATHFSSQWRTIRSNTITGASLWILMGVFTGVWLYLKMFEYIYRFIHKFYHPSDLNYLYIVIIIIIDIHI